MAFVKPSFGTFRYYLWITFEPQKISTFTELKKLIQIKAIIA